ncbi:MAG: UDP binding domain-containing protein, partial [Alphaproteobacteria bacterium]
MGTFLAGQIADAFAGAVTGDEATAASAAADGGGPARRALVLGLTFKEDVPDLRNSRVADLIGGLAGRGFDVVVHDPLADPGEAEREYGLRIVGGQRPPGGFDLVVGAVAHQTYRRFTAEDLTRLVRRGGLVADIKGMWREVTLADGYGRWTL